MTVFGGHHKLTSAMKLRPEKYQIILAIYKGDGIPKKSLSQGSLQAS